MIEMSICRLKESGLAEWLLKVFGLNQCQSMPEQLTHMSSSDEVDPIVCR